MDTVTHVSSDLHRSRVVRGIYLVLGFVALGLGVVGFWVPGMPGTVFLLLAAFFWSRSSQRWHDWLMGTRFGPMIRDYQAGNGIPRRIKAIAATAIVLSVGLSAGFAIQSLPIRLVVLALGVCGVWFVLSRPTTEVVLATD